MLPTYYILPSYSHFYSTPDDISYTSCLPTFQHKDSCSFSLYCVSCFSLSFVFFIFIFPVYAALCPFHSESESSTVFFYTPVQVGALMRLRLVRKKEEDRKRTGRAGAWFLYYWKPGNMAGLELLSDQGYRLDGRKATELRKVQARMGVFAQADGSAYLEQGNTKALAVVYGPHEVSYVQTQTQFDSRIHTCKWICLKSTLIVIIIFFCVYTLSISHVLLAFFVLQFKSLGYFCTRNYLVLFCASLFTQEVIQ